MVFWGFVVYYKKHPGAMAPHGVRVGYLGRAGGWGPVVPGVCTVHRLVLTPTVTTLEPHAALCPTIKFLLVAEEGAVELKSIWAKKFFKGSEVFTILLVGALTGA